MLSVVVIMKMTHVKIHDFGGIGQTEIWTVEHYSKRKKNVSSIQSRIQTHIQSVTENKHFGNKALNIKMTMILKCQENAPIHAFRGKKNNYTYFIE